MNELFSQIAPAQALQIKAESYSNGRLTLSAPLAPNRNDKGSAFAGSIASILSLAGWGAITLALRDEQLDCDVMIVESQISYLRPVRGTLTATATVQLTDAQLEKLRKTGRLRIATQCDLVCNAEKCASLEAHYAVFLIKAVATEFQES